MMLPEPEKVARAIKKIFRSAGERRTEAEMDRDVKIKLGRSKIQRYIQNQKKMVVQLRDLAKRALSINDEDRFRQIGRQLLWTQGNIKRWEQYLLSLDLLQARRDQANSSIEMINTIKVMSESMSENIEPQNIAEIHKELETSLARASNMDERMAVMMDLVDSTISTDLPVNEKNLKELENQLAGEIVTEEAMDFGREIDKDLNGLRDQLENEK